MIIIVEPKNLSKNNNNSSSSALLIVNINELNIYVQHFEM